jgi:hypothetical protein
MPNVRQRLGKHIPEVTLSTIGHPLLDNGLINTHSWQYKAAFSVWPVPWNFKRAQSGVQRRRVVRGDEMESLKSETVKYSLEFQGTRTRERLRWQGPAAYAEDRPILSSERAPTKENHKCQIVKNIWSWAPDGGSTPSLTDWLAVSRNVTLTLTLTWVQRSTREYNGVVEFSPGESQNSSSGVCSRRRWQVVR